MPDSVTQERERLLQEYERREREIDPQVYAPSNPVELFMRAGRLRLAEQMLRSAGVFPQPGEPCLEVGYGRLGWLGDLVEWGLDESDLHGIELDERRAADARQAFPRADLRIGDATDMPWPEAGFRLVVASTVFTSILDPAVRHRVAEEITRVLEPGGALLWYDFAWNNPRNPAVQKVTRRELRRLFPTLEGAVRSVTLAPPIARVVVPWSRSLATFLEALPILRTHLLAVLIKEGVG
jgi:ubiquinone/menaquinone biosynthesis C-methylase UbiE